MWRPSSSRVGHADGLPGSTAFRRQPGSGTSCSQPLLQVIQQAGRSRSFEDVTASLYGMLVSRDGIWSQHACPHAYLMTRGCRLAWRASGGSGSWLDSEARARGRTEQMSWRLCARAWQTGRPMCVARPWYVDVWSINHVPVIILRTTNDNLFPRLEDHSTDIEAAAAAITHMHHDRS